MTRSARYTCLSVHPALGAASHMPMLPFQLRRYSNTTTVTGLLDSGATVNVMPFHIGEELGAIWDEQTISLRLNGNLANLEARALLVKARIAEFDEVELAFAWSKSNEVPLILGQVNFFIVFDVCFYRAELAFEIRPR